MPKTDDSSKMISFRATEEEDRTWRESAQAAGLSLSDYIRRRLNGVKVVPKTPLADAQTLTTLRQIGGLIKASYRQGSITKSELETALTRIEMQIEKIARSE